MRLPEEDEDYLRQKGFDWELIPVEEEGCLVLKGYSVSATVYDRSATDVMIRIPAQYNNAALDMFYCDPPLKLKNGGYPNRADHFENHVGRKWQRFSRHFPTPWRPGVDGLPTLLTFVQRELSPKS
jgi:hypothetical protein